MLDVVCPTCRAPLAPDAAFCPQCGPDPLVRLTTEPEGLEQADPGTVARLEAALGPQFDVVGLFGRGGFAEVYEVRDTELERRLAVKVLRADLVWTPGMLARFKQEARAVAQLTHPNTVPIHFVGEGQGLVFYVMPFIEGATLADVLRAQGPLDAERAVSVALPVLEALDHAHANGIVHRDIKPDNILIESGTGRPLLVDFGISKRMSEDGAIPDAHDGIVVGTPLYMSPEQALGHSDVDARTDIYAMGALLYQMLVGAPPFDGDTSHEIVAKHLTDPVRIPPACAARLPSWIVDVIVRAMAKQPADRFQSASDMLEPLRQGARRHRGSALSTDGAAPNRVNRDDPTLQMGTAETLAARVTGFGRVRRRRVTLLASGVGVAGFGLAAALAGAPSPALVVENGLSDSVAVVVNGSSPQTVRPGDSLRVFLARGAALTAEWRLLGPRALDGRSGDELHGVIADESPRGEIRRRLDPSGAGANYVVARATNTTADSLGVTLRDSAGAVLPCDCTVPPGATDAQLGYLRTGRIQSVTFTNSAGGSVTFDSLARRADRVTRAVWFRLDSADFSRRATTAARPRRNSTAVRAELPELKLTEPPLLPDTAAVSDSAPRPATDSAPRPADPIRSIFPNSR